MPKSRRGARLKRVRALGPLPGLTSKESKKKLPPGQHGKRLKKLSDYGLQLREKQKLKFNYGITEKQLISYFKKALKCKEPAGIALLKILEMRFDNIVFRLGMAPTIPAARQLVRHNHLLVNEKKANIPSMLLKVGDRIKPSSKETSQTLIQKWNLKPSFILPEHLTFNKENLEGLIINVASRDSILFDINEIAVIGYYSKKI